MIRLATERDIAEVEKIFEEIMAENFLNLLKNINLHVSEFH